MSKSNEKALVINSNTFSIALAVVRSLREMNVNTTLLTQEGSVRNIFSRYRSEIVRCPSTREDTDGFLRTLLRLVEDREYLTIFPLTDDAVALVSRIRDAVGSHLRLVLPAPNSVEKALDRSKTLSDAEKLGIPTPKTFRPKTLSELKSVSEGLSFPAVVKPRSSFAWSLDGKAQYSRPFYVNSLPELIETYKRVNNNFLNPIIQEYIHGYNISAAFLFDRGEPKAACCIKVYRTIPITGGTSVFRESIKPDQTILRYATSLLRSLKWHGVAEVEFRIDSMDSKPKLMEINPRLWGSVEVAIRSGIDFPKLMFLMARGEKIEQVENYKTGIKVRWLQGDIQHLKAILRGEGPKGILPLKKSSALINFLRTPIIIHYDMLSKRDPLPFIAQEVFLPILHKAV